MGYVIENEYLRLEADGLGAQLKSLVCKQDGVEHLWQADPGLWKYSAPLLFPWCGKQAGGAFTVNGRSYPAKQHGFARELDHELIDMDESSLSFCLCSSQETLELWPFPFRLVTRYELSGMGITQTVTVENTGDGVMSFGLGFHPGFALPFDQGHSYRDYELRFSSLDSPQCIRAKEGLMTRELYSLGRNLESLDLTEHLFDNDSHCMAGLASDRLGLFEKDSGRGLWVEVRDFPYCLIWSKPGIPRFLCIEPWHSLPSFQGDGPAWEERISAARLRPGERWSTELRIEIVR